MPRIYGFFKKENGEIQVIHYIKGILTLKTESGIVIETAGIGYEITVPQSSALYLCEEGEEVCCYIHMAVREDDIRLYGFSDNESLTVFRMLLGVNGVGAKAAVAILSVLSPAQFKQAVISGDDKEIARAQGVGKKIAQRIVLELGDRMGNIDIAVKEGPVTAGEDLRGQAIEALCALGYTRQEAGEALKGVDGEDTETMIRKALKNLF